MKESGIGLTGILFIVFLVLKLLGKIEWSWWWVTCPLWAFPLLIISVLLIVFVFSMIAKVIGGI